MACKRFGLHIHGPQGMNGHMTFWLCNLPASVTVSVGSSKSSTLHLPTANELVHFTLLSCSRQPVRCTFFSSKSSERLLFSSLCFSHVYHIWCIWLHQQMFAGPTFNVGYIRLRSWLLITPALLWALCTVRGDSVNPLGAPWYSRFLAHRQLARRGFVYMLVSVCKGEGR